jgi:hypothetical protein
MHIGHNAAFLTYRSLELRRESAGRAGSTHRSGETGAKQAAKRHKQR